MLQQLTQYLRQQKKANLWDLATSLNSEPDVVRSMLALMVRKGRVRRCGLDIKGCASKCQKCGPKVTELYEWVY